MSIPPDWQRRNPLLTEAGWAALQRVLEHAHAPAWSHQLGDRVTAADLDAVRAFRQLPDEPPEAIRARVERWSKTVPWLMERLPPGLDLDRDWHRVPTSSREDLATRVGEMVPLGVELDRMFAYETSGTTTGHAAAVPVTPRGTALNHVLAERALARHGVTPTFGLERPACVQICAQHRTWTFATAFSVWNQAPFAKVNLNRQVWSPEDARAFLTDLAPVFLSGDPVGFTAMLEWGIELRPAALISSAVTLSPALKARLEQAYGCPVIDWYSVTETGPIAATDPHGPGHAILPPDLYVEVLGPDGQPVAPGELGEITVTGGRNEVFPLIRYRTGDRARRVDGRLLDLEGRAPVWLKAADGSPVNPVDLGRLMQMRAPFAQHALLQRRDGSVHLRLRPVPGVPVDLEGVRSALHEVMGDVALEVELDEQLGERGKVAPYAVE